MTFHIAKWATFEDTPPWPHALTQNMRTLRKRPSYVDNLYQALVEPVCMRSWRSLVFIWSECVVACWRCQMCVVVCGRVLEVVVCWRCHCRCMCRKHSWWKSKTERHFCAAVMIINVMYKWSVSAENMKSDRKKPTFVLVFHDDFRLSLRI